MIYTFLQKIFARSEYRKVNVFTDSYPSEGHKFNYKFAKPYIHNKYVLDVGCWTGQFEKLAIKNVKTIVGVDPNEDAINFAKRTNKKAIFVKGSAIKLPINSEKFDIATFFDVIEHVPIHTEITCLKEIHRVLKPKGILLLCTPNKHVLSVLFDPVFWARGHRHYSRDELKNMLEKCGFRIRTSFTVGGIWTISTFIFSMVTKHMLKVKLNFPKVVNQKIKNEFKPGGIMSIYIIADKY